MHDFIIYWKLTRLSHKAYSMFAYIQIIVYIQTPWYEVLIGYAENTFKYSKHGLWFFCSV